MLVFNVESMLWVLNPTLHTGLLLMLRNIPSTALLLMISDSLNIKQRTLYLYPNYLNLNKYLLSKHQNLNITYKRMMYQLLGSGVMSMELIILPGNITNISLSIVDHVGPREQLQLFLIVSTLLMVVTLWMVYYPFKSSLTVKLVVRAKVETPMVYTNLLNNKVYPIRLANNM
jgi:hypothetical protein